MTLYIKMNRHLRMMLQHGLFYLHIIVIVILEEKVVEAVLVWDNVQGKFQCPGHVLDIVPDMSRPSVPSKYPIIFRYNYNKGFKLTYLGQY